MYQVYIGYAVFLSLGANFQDLEKDLQEQGYEYIRHIKDDFHVLRHEGFNFEGDTEYKFPEYIPVKIMPVPPWLRGMLQIPHAKPAYLPDTLLTKDEQGTNELEQENARLKAVDPEYSEYLRLSEKFGKRG